VKKIGAVLQENRGIGPGFDFLRVFLALSIVAFHSLSVTGQYCSHTPHNLDVICPSPSLDDTPFWMVHYALVPMFFALSGFLISASAMRLSLKNFLINRGMRIVPALAVDTVVCALIIGPLFTTVTLGQYFGSSEFASFFLNIVGWVHFDLPGVFTTNAVPRVNGSLWTVPFEVICYVLMSGMIITKIIRTQFVVLAFVGVYLVCSVLVEFSGLLNHMPSPLLEKIISIAFIKPEAQAVTAFLFGIILFQNRHIIPYSIPLFAVSVLTVVVIAFTLTFEIGQTSPLRFVLMPALAYMTVFVGLTPMPLPAFFKTGDYSYGIYLYHQPFLQIIVVLFPALALAPHTGAGFAFLAGLPFVIGVAWLSWHLIEKPILALRKRFSMVAKIRGVTDAAKTQPINTQPRPIQRVTQPSLR
jgi:peptidoglycan/LPS O-acetylase OafA/YrhL